jgi:hypothetical protein
MIFYNFLIDRYNSLVSNISPIVNDVMLNTSPWLNIFSTEVFAFSMLIGVLGLCFWVFNSGLFLSLLKVMIFTTQWAATKIIDVIVTCFKIIQANLFEIAFFYCSVIHLYLVAYVGCVATVVFLCQIGQPLLMADIFISMLGNAGADLGWVCNNSDASYHEVMSLSANEVRLIDHEGKFQGKNCFLAVELGEGSSKLCKEHQTGVSWVVVLSTSLAVVCSVLILTALRS